MQTRNGDGLRQVWRQLEGTRDVALDHRIHFLSVDVFAQAVDLLGHQPALRQGSMGRRVIGVEVERLLELALCGLDILCRP